MTPPLFVELPQDTWIELQGTIARIGTIDVATIQPFIDALRAAGLMLRRVQPVRPSLEDLFMETVGGVAGGHQAGGAIGKTPPLAAVRREGGKL